MKTYEYCFVQDVDEKKVDDTVYAWVAHCDGGANVVFSRVIHKGDGIYFNQYTEDGDRAIRGYIKSIKQVVP